ncbi:MAG: hypothetical protein ABIP39_11775 [Polyangiaceae bacterium]
MATHATNRSSALAADALEKEVVSAGAQGATSPGAAATTERSSSRVWAALGIVTSMAVLVFWLFDALPFQDLPAHAGLIAMRHRFVDSPFEQRFFVLAPHIGPYSLFRLLGEALVRVIGPVSAVRALASLPMIATPGALLFARRRLHADHAPTVGFLGVTLSFGLMTLFGFASYLLGVAVMLVGLTLWLELMVAVDDNRPDLRKKELIVLAYAPLIFVAHGHAFVLFLILAGVASLATGNRRARILRLWTLFPAVALAAWVAWIERGSTGPPGSVPVSTRGLEPHFQGVYDKASLLITPTLMTRTGVDFALGCVIWVFVLIAGVATVRSLRTPSSAADPVAESISKRHSAALFAGAACLAIVFVALPHAIGWFGFVDGRLVPLFLFLCLIGLRLPALGRSLRAAFERGAPVMAFTMTGLMLLASYRFQAEAKGYREVLGAIPNEARVLNLPLDPNSDIFTAHPFVHYDKLVLAERPILVSDIWFHQGSALYPTPQNPALRLPRDYCESDLHGIDWSVYKLEDWSHVLIRTRPDGAAPQIPATLSLSEHRGGWWLYKTNGGAR